jgi:8-hydroxy-5-deazaflavin:NADPH oxidoreductase
MRIGILGTGSMAAALAQAWVRAGHTVALGGRSAAKAAALAERLGDGVTATAPGDLSRGSDAVVIAVSWDGIDDALKAAGAPEGYLAGTTLIDCTNAVDFASGRLIPASGSAVEYIAGVAVGANVVKALHLYAGQSWLTPVPSDAPPRVVAMCGNDKAALDIAGELVRDVGGAPVVIGGLERGRQLEEVAGFVVSLVRAGINPVTAIPAVTGS